MGNLGKVTCTLELGATLNLVPRYKIQILKSSAGSSTTGSLMEVPFSFGQEEGACGSSSECQAWPRWDKSEKCQSCFDNYTTIITVRLNFLCHQFLVARTKYSMNYWFGIAVSSNSIICIVDPVYLSLLFLPGLGWAVVKNSIWENISGEIVLGYSWKLDGCSRHCQLTSTDVWHDWMVYSIHIGKNIFPVFCKINFSLLASLILVSSLLVFATPVHSTNSDLLKLHMILKNLDKFKKFVHIIDFFFYFIFRWSVICLKCD